MKARYFTILAILSIVFVSVLSSAGCNTVKGLGTDLSNASDATTRAIDKAGK